MMQLRTLIVDGDVLCRDTLRTVLSGESDLEVVALASSGKLGLDRVSQLRPDVVILDAGLADMAPADFTGTVLTVSPQTGVILTCTDDGACADRVIDALEGGAFDFVLKPTGRCKPENTTQLQRLLLQKIRCFSSRRYSQIAKSFSLGTKPPDSPAADGKRWDSPARTGHGDDHPRNRVLPGRSSLRLFAAEAAARHHATATGVRRQEARPHPHSFLRL